MYRKCDYFCSWRSLCWSSRVAKGSEISEARLGVDSLWDRCFWELDMQVLRLETLRRGLAEYGSPSLCWRVKVEAFKGGGGVGGGKGESETDRLWKGAVAGCGTLDFLTWTEEGRSEDTCFSRDRICGKTGGSYWKWWIRTIAIYWSEFGLSKNCNWGKKNFFKNTQLMKVFI